MEGFEKLDLSTETIRELTQSELDGVAGGRPPQPTPPQPALTYGLCPSGATWFMDCDSIRVTCG